MCLRLHRGDGARTGPFFQNLRQALRLVAVPLRDDDGLYGLAAERAHHIDNAPPRAGRSAGIHQNKTVLLLDDGDVADGLYLEFRFGQKPDAGNDICTIWKLSLIHISEPTRQAEISYAVFCLK